ncbi:unnamed protein product [Euphydryas editha]|uniref:RanBP-type and C3HC4-type zinc finger-containing protein 1 n=1 Tax=Euphydryas editha TaxID=104508 RepID=A0AAU9V267_EUPED|nr:unnamed protein product [Euphydryas editha]
MNGDVEEEAPRLRPLSGGIWTLFSWLRRSERSSSEESVASVGSDRTTASFDFLAPFHYKNATSPLVLPQSPLTETYKKRLHERNLRRQFDRDLTLRRKYGLYTEDGLGYDAFSLPPARKISKDSAQGRQRRATSESIQPRAAYVPGKRRAPLPPTLVISTSLPRNYKRKRPAPKPPVKLTENNKENVKVNEEIQMNSKPVLDKLSSESKSIVEKDSKKSHSNKDVKLRTEKSFLKQIFENRKRNSAIDTSYIKVLPSISELDRQAAEIIQTNKSLSSGSESFTKNNWICTNCLRKYNATVISCTFCSSGKSYSSEKVDMKISTGAFNMCTQTEKNILEPNKSEIDDKIKLKKMLKEMKDSLPKRPKNNEENSVDYKYNMASNETPTLRIGTTIKEDIKAANDPILHKNHYERKLQIKNAKDNFLTSQPSSSKETPFHIKHENDVKITNKALCYENKNDIGESSFSSSSKDFVTKQSMNTLENKNLEQNLNPNNIVSPLVVAKDNMLISVNHANKITHENKLPPLIQESKTVSNEILIKSPKITDSKLSPNGINKANKTCEKSPLNNNKNILKCYALPESTKTIEVTQKIITVASLLPTEETKVVSATSDFINKKKSENLRLNDGVSSSASQKVESNAIVSSKISKNIDLHTPLKISSLLNPLNNTKHSNPDDKTKFSQINDTKKLEFKEEPKACETKQILVSNISKEPSKNVNSSLLHTTCLKMDITKDKETNDKLKQKKLSNPLPNNSTASTSNNNLDHHARRRDLINQLEQSIARGDEQTAAEAAAKLAKLKLSCSVLSFSSQIVSGPLISQNKVENFNSDIIDKKVLQPNEKSKINVKTELKVALPIHGTTKSTNTIVCKGNKSAEEAIADKAVPSTSKQILDQIIPIEVWIEDKEATRGPIRLTVSRKAVLGELKQEAERSLGLQIRLQRWIIGKTLCSNDSTSLNTLAGPDLTAPFYLCLVDSDISKDTIPEITNDKEKNKNEGKHKDSNGVYTELMKLEQQALVPNSEEFECGVCIEQCAVGAGVVLRECIHAFCRECLADAVRHCTEPVVSCPAIACPGALQEREIRALLSPEDYEKWLARSLAAAESGTRNTFHCRTRDCTGWAFCEPGVRRFPCPVCKHTNCLPCQTVHDGETCEQYQQKLREAVTAVETEQTDAGTQALLKSLIDRGEALECPECKTIITKKWGCDWIKCSACKTEICWVTKGRRWGPGGKGDTTGGCRCGIDGKRCHPSCGYCH